MRFLRWGRCSSRKRKKPTSSRTKRVVLLKRVFTCVYACTTVESKLEWTRVRWRVVVVVLLRRARVLRFGGWCAQTIRERFFIDRSKRKDISRAQKRTRDENFSSEREREREDLARAAIKNFFAAIFLIGGSKTFCFVFLFFLFSCFFFQQAVFTGKKNEKFGLNSASKRPHWKSDNYSLHTSNYGQKNEIGEKSREIGTTKRRGSRAWRWDALSPFAALLFCALLSVFIYIYLMYKSRFPQFKGVSFPQFSHSRGD